MEIRWCERKTGKKLMNDWGYYYDETVIVLQYRDKDGNWIDVPTVPDEKDITI
jgi:hypothetical protein